MHVRPWFNAHPVSGTTTVARPRSTTLHEPRLRCQVCLLIATLPIDLSRSWCSRNRPQTPSSTSQAGMIGLQTISHKCLPVHGFKPLHGETWLRTCGQADLEVTPTLPACHEPSLHTTATLIA